MPCGFNRTFLPRCLSPWWILDSVMSQPPLAVHDVLAGHLARHVLVVLGTRASGETRVKAAVAEGVTHSRL